VRPMRLVDEEDARDVRVALRLGDTRLPKGRVEVRPQLLLRRVQLEVIGAVALAAGLAAAGTVAARLARVVLVIPAATAHAADAGGRRLAAAIIPGEDHAAGVTHQLLLAAQALDGGVVDALPYLVVTARTVLGAEIVVAAGHKSCAVGGR